MMTFSSFMVIMKTPMETRPIDTYRLVGYGNNLSNLTEKQSTMVRRRHRTVPTVLPTAKNIPIIELDMPCSSFKKIGPTAKL